jgi:hypothetical protein
MHRAKKAIKQLKEYLGRDTQGVKFLDEISLIVNDLRKDAATASETSQTAERIADRLKDEAIKLRDQVAQVSQDLRQAEAKISQLERQSDARAKDVVNVDHETTDVDSRDINVSTLNSMFKRLMRDIPNRPEPARVPWSMMESLVNADDKPSRSRRRFVKEEARAFIPGMCETYDLRDLVSGYSAAEMITLGRMVALNASIGNALVVYCSKLVLDVDPRKMFMETAGKPDRFSEMWVRWTRNNAIGKVNTDEEARLKLVAAASSRHPDWIGHRQCPTG